MPSLFTLPLAALIATAAGAWWGPKFESRGVPDGSYIAELSTTIYLPRLPTSSFNDLSLTMGMRTSSGDIIETLIIHEKYTDHWKIVPYVIEKIPGPPLVYHGHQSNTILKGKKNDQLTIHYKYDKRSRKYTQTATINSQSSSFTFDSGHALGFFTALACLSSKCGTSATHEYVNTVIKLSAPYPIFNTWKTFSKGVSLRVMKTMDGGVTWWIPHLIIPQHTFGKN